MLAVNIVAGVQPEKELKSEGKRERERRPRERVAWQSLGSEKALLLRAGTSLYMQMIRRISSIRISAARCRAASGRWLVHGLIR